jgi:hypothetical protein
MPPTPSDRAHARPSSPSSSPTATRSFGSPTRRSRCSVPLRRGGSARRGSLRFGVAPTSRGQGSPQTRAEVRVRGRCDVLPKRNGRGPPRCARAPAPRRAAQRQGRPRGRAIVSMRLSW